MKCINCKDKAPLICWTCSRPALVLVVMWLLEKLFNN